MPDDKKKLTIENLKEATEIYLRIGFPNYKKHQEIICEKIMKTLQKNSSYELIKGFYIPTKGIIAPYANMIITTHTRLKEQYGIEYLLQVYDDEKDLRETFKIQDKRTGDTKEIAKQIEDTWIKEGYPTWKEYNKLLFNLIEI